MAEPRFTCKILPTGFACTEEHNGGIQYAFPVLHPMVKQGYIRHHINYAVAGITGEFHILGCYAIAPAFLRVKFANYKGSLWLPETICHKASGSHPGNPDD